MSDKSNTPLEELRKAVVAQKTVEFPRVESADPDIQDVAVRLTEYDRLVSQMVIQVLRGEMPGPYPEQKDPDLDNELTALHQIKSEAGQKILEQFIRYKSRLDRMFDLVTEISKESSHPDISVELVSVYTTNSLPEAEMIRSLLETMNIPASTSQESVGRTYGLSISPLGTVEVLVPSTHALQARQVLDEYASAGDQDFSDTDADEDDTPQETQDTR